MTIVISYLALNTTAFLIHKAFVAISLIIINDSILYYHSGVLRAGQMGVRCVGRVRATDNSSAISNSP